MNERIPTLVGAACADLPPTVADKYFNANSNRDRFETQTAKAICGKCPVREECLDQAVNGAAPAPPNGVVAGLSAHRITILRQWRAYDCGARDVEPYAKRPSVEIPTVSEAQQTADRYRMISEMSFEERVFGVFSDLRNGRYNGDGGITRAIGDIAFIRADMDAVEQTNNQLAPSLSEAL